MQPTPSSRVIFYTLNFAKCYGRPNFLEAIPLQMMLKLAINMLLLGPRAVNMHPSHSCALSGSKTATRISPNVKISVWLCMLATTSALKRQRFSCMGAVADWLGLGSGLGQRRGGTGEKLCWASAFSSKENSGSHLALP